MLKQRDMSTFYQQLAEKAALTGQVIQQILDDQPEIPPRLKSAMGYMLQGGGKRIRSVLAMWCCELICGQLNKEAQIAAAAIEMVHTYSLIHDDLPAMDNDDFRRGKPSCHKQFDEATAILAGDALLTLAFEIIAKQIKEPSISVRMIRTLAEAAGPAGMIAGQIADLMHENQVGTAEQLKYIHIHKTAKMFAASAALGGIAGGADDQQLSALLSYGLNLGLGFQIADDLLDVTANSEQLGKTAGKDVQQGKLTYPALMGIDESRRQLQTLTDQAILAIKPFGGRAVLLEQLALELQHRTK